jgi:hypothetical protein
MRIALRVLLDRSGHTTVRVALAKHGVHGGAQHLGVTSLDVLILSGVS